MCSFYDDCFFVVAYLVCSLFICSFTSVISTCVLKKSFEYHIGFVVAVVGASRIDETLLKTIIMIFIALVYLTGYVTLVMLCVRCALFRCM